MNKIICISIFLFLTNFLFGQNDSIPTLEETLSPTLLIDSTENVIEKDSTTSKTQKRNFIVRYFKEDYPSPKKAAILSLILPGAGQIYNKKAVWIKLPIVYGGLATGIYFLDGNTRQYKYLRDEYRKIVDGDDLTVSDFQSVIDEGRVTEATIKAERDKFNQWRQYTYIGFIAGYLLVASEAYVTAHLISFDVSDDLSLHIDPNIKFTPDNQLYTGIGIQMKFNAREKSKPIPFLVKP